AGPALPDVNVPGPVYDAANQLASGDVPAVPAAIPHLASPDNLPPGYTADPSQLPPEGPNVSYLKELWQAVQTQDISGKEALLLGLSQRGMNTPIPADAPGPNTPVMPGDVPPPPPGAPLPPA
ncbi:MAG: transglycosylase-like protein, partial [Mycobacterium sp.]|nr:transglycosylase-like protein [Mycobacterium sp.]